MGRAVIRLSDLRDARVKTLDGETLGRVHEVHAEGGRIDALTCGPGSFIESLTAKKQGPANTLGVRGQDRSTSRLTVVPDPPQR